MRTRQRNPRALVELARDQMPALRLGETGQEIFHLRGGGRGRKRAGPKIRRRPLLRQRVRVPLKAVGSTRLRRVQSGVAPDCGGTRDFSRARMNDWRSTPKSFGRDARNHPRGAGATTNHNDIGAFISRWRKVGRVAPRTPPGSGHERRARSDAPHGGGRGKRGGRLQRPPGAASRRCQNRFGMDYC